MVTTVLMLQIAILETTHDFPNPLGIKKKYGHVFCPFFLIAYTFVYKVTKYVLKNNAQNKSLKQKGIQRDFKNSLAES